ncbi:hypothetical protein EON79_16265, partial [bacterium]
MRFLLLLLALIATLANAQDVRTTSSSIPTKRYLRAALEAGKSWPDLGEGDRGTIVQLTCDYRNADITLVSDQSVETMLPKAKRIAASMGFPLADFITRQGPITGTVDMEFNDYLQPQNRTVDWVVALSKLRREMEAAGLPKPYAWVVRNRIESVRMEGTAGERALKEGFTYLEDRDIARYDRIVFRERMAAWAPFAGHLFVFGIVGVVGAAFAGTVVLRLKKRKESGAPVQPALKTPEEIQAEYDARKGWQRWLPNLIPLLFPLIFIGGTRPELMRQVTYGMPNWFDRASESPFMIVLPLFLCAGLLVRTAMSRKSRGMWLLLSTALMVIVLLSTVFLNPVWFRTLPVNIRLYGLLGIITVMVMTLCVSILFSPSHSKKLPKDDPLVLEVKALGEAAGLKVRQVHQLDYDMLNAYAHIFGTVGVTRGLREQMEPDEVRAILAHE